MITSVLRQFTHSQPIALLIKLATISLLDPLEAELMHLNSQLQDVINALALRLRLVHIITPDITIQRLAHLPHPLLFRVTLTSHAS